MSYLDTYTEMMQLRGLQPHTLKNYKTYIIAYLDYAENILHKEPEAITWSEMREFIRWLQDSRQLADRTVNMAISQLRFFTIFVLHKPWDETQLPHRKFDTFLPFVPSQDEVKSFLNSIENLKFRAVAYYQYCRHKKPHLSKKALFVTKYREASHNNLINYLNYTLFFHFCQYLPSAEKSLRLLTI